MADIYGVSPIVISEQSMGRTYGKSELKEEVENWRKCSNIKERQ